MSGDLDLFANNNIDKKNILIKVSKDTFLIFKI